MSYDKKCGDLARHFLSGHKAKIPDTAIADTVARLAQKIQDAVEDFMFEEGL